MSEVHDPERLRSLLDTDRPWALYLLGDLEPEFRPHARWWRQGDAVALLYRGFGLPVLLTFGPPDAVRPLLSEMPPEPQIYLHVRPEVLPLVGELYDLPSPSPMMRMLFQGNAARGSSQPGVTRLGAPDLARLEELYADGHARSEGPGFFSPDMLARGVYFGMRDGDGLCAVAGTHLLAPAARAAAIGNIYTRFDCRGRGFGAATTAAVVEALAASGMTTIGLSVREDNTAAIRVYERLGFVRHCAFIEGLATRRGGG